MVKPLERDWEQLLERSITARDIIDIAEPWEPLHYCPSYRGIDRPLRSSLGRIPLTLPQDIRPKQPDMQDREGTLGDEFSA